MIKKTFFLLAQVFFLTLIFQPQGVQAVACNGTYKCVQFTNPGCENGNILRTTSCGGWGGTQAQCYQAGKDCPGGCVYNDLCNWDCTGNTSNQGCFAAGCGYDSNGVGTERRCTCSGNENWSCNCVPNAAACGTNTVTPTPTSPPGCVPSCNTSNCGSTQCGQACGNDGCGHTCGSGTLNCGGGSCTVQGFKVMMPANAGAAPGSSQTVSVSGATSTSAQPYIISTTAGSHTTSVTVPSGGYGTGYSQCTSVQAQCGAANDPAGYHGTNRIGVGSSFTTNCPGGGITDLWWHFFPPPTGTITGPSCLNANVAGTYTLTRSGNSALTQSVFYTTATAPGSFTSVQLNTTATSVGVTIPSPGNYYVTTNVIGTYGDQCSGNPFSTPAGYGNCGASDNVPVTVYAMPATPPLPSANSVCSGVGGFSDGNVTVTWSGGTYDLMRFIGSSAPSDTVANTLTPIALNASSGQADSAAPCGSTVIYGLRANNACNGHTYRWASAATVVKCNPSTPSAPIAGSGAFQSISVTNWTAGDTMWKSSSTTNVAPATSAAPATPYATSLVSTPDTNVICTTPVQNYYFYSARRSRGSGGNICYANSVPSNGGTCVPNPQWFLTSGGDVTSVNSSLTNPMPTPMTTIGGVITGNPITWSVTNYKVTTDVSQSLLINNSFLVFANHATAKAGANMNTLAINDLSGYANNLNTFVTTAAFQAKKVDQAVYFDITPPSGTFTLTGGTDLGAQRAVLIVHGNVLVNSQVLAGSNSQGGGLVVLASGDITVSSGMGVASDPRIARTPDMQGIYIAGGRFYDTNGDEAGKTLRIEGSVIGLGGVTFARKSGTAVYPHTYIIFRPDYIINMPSGLKMGTRLFEELAP